MGKDHHIEIKGQGKVVQQLAMHALRISPRTLDQELSPIYIIDDITLRTTEIQNKSLISAFAIILMMQFLKCIGQRLVNT